MTEPVLGFAVPPIVRTILVRSSPETAFRRFTADLGAWWPLRGFHVGTEPQSCALETRLGGRLFERAADGTETLWGRVVLWEPPHRLAFSWVIGLDEARAQRIEVSFAAEPGGTRVTLTHSGWEAFGDAAAAKRALYEGGWATVFGEAYRAYAETGQRPHDPAPATTE
jgi:uncharacterized protein YndB with AHSA1/START domain